MLLFPSKLKVIFQDKIFFFNSLEAAWDWATEEPKVRLNRPPPWGDVDQAGAPVGTPVPKERCNRKRSRSNRWKKGLGQGEELTQRDSVPGAE